MKISTKGRYSVTALYELALRYGEGAVSLKSIATSQGLSENYLEQLMAPLRRAGIVERIDADQWRIPDDLVSRAADYDAGRDRQASVRVLSPVDLQRQIRSDGATWLDRRLIHGETADLASVGFGQQVREAMDQRREHHIEQGDASRARNGRVFYRRSLLATLREREVARVGAEMAESKRLPFRAATDGERVVGKAWRILSADYVTTDDGTGLVHMAPAFGEEDKAATDAAGIPVVVPVDESAEPFQFGPLVLI